MEKSEYFIPENKSPDEVVHLSPSGRYKLTVSRYATKPGCWSYSRGIVSDSEGREIADIQRNYSMFPFSWVEDHPSGHSYLVAGEDYQGQTVVELDTARRRDTLSDGTDKGWGFCWAEHRFDAASQILVVCGCYWACPYEYRFYDFSDPMVGWPEIESEEGTFDDDKWPTFEPDGTIKCYQTRGDDTEEEDPEKRTLASVVTFKREGLSLVKVAEWVSGEEAEQRAKQEAAAREYEQWLRDFRATDPLYLAMKEHLKDPGLSPESHGEGVGVTYKDWCPEFSGNERRMCKRIVTTKPYTVDLEWGVQTGPIKLVRFKDGKVLSPQFYPHSVEGIHAAFEATLAFTRGG